MPEWPLGKDLYDELYREYLKAIGHKERIQERKQPAPSEPPTQEPTVTKRGNDLMLLADQTSATADQFLESLKQFGAAEIDKVRQEQDERAKLEQRVRGIYIGYTDKAQGGLSSLWNRCSYVPPKKLFRSGTAPRSHDFTRQVEERGRPTLFCRICEMPKEKARQQVAAMHLARKLIEKDIDSGIIVLDDTEAAYLDKLWVRDYPGENEGGIEEFESFRTRLTGAAERIRQESQERKTRLGKRKAEAEAQAKSA